MKRATKVFIAIGGIFLGTYVAEQVFLSRLEYSVIHDDARLDGFLKSLPYPIWVEPGYGFCRFGGTRLGYTYQFCLAYRGNPLGCPSGTVTLEYLGPQGKFSLVSDAYHDSETVFRREILSFDRDGNICSIAPKED